MSQKKKCFSNCCKSSFWGDYTITPCPTNTDRAPPCGPVQVAEKRKAPSLPPSRAARTFGWTEPPLPGNGSSCCLSSQCRQSIMNIGNYVALSTFILYKTLMSIDSHSETDEQLFSKPSEGWFEKPTKQEVTSIPRAHKANAQQSMRVLLWSPKLWLSHLVPEARCKPWIWPQHPFSEPRPSHLAFIFGCSKLIV